MMRWLLGLVILLGSLPLAAQTTIEPVDGYCTLGGSKALVSGLASTNYQQGLIPGCTVSVYLHGTTTLATIYADDHNTPLSNPFTAVVPSSPNSGYWIFWAAAGGDCYDVVGSGGTAPITYPAPITIEEVCLGAAITGNPAKIYLAGVDSGTDGTNYVVTQNNLNANSNACPTSLTDGVTFNFIPLHTNTSTTPTFQGCGLGSPATIVKNGTTGETALVNGDIFDTATGAVAQVVWNSATSHWDLRTPSVSATTQIYLADNHPLDSTNGNFPTPCPGSNCIRTPDSWIDNTAFMAPLGPTDPRNDVVQVVPCAIPTGITNVNAQCTISSVTPGDILVLDSAISCGTVCNVSGASVTDNNGNSWTIDASFGWSSGTAAVTAAAHAVNVKGGNTTVTLQETLTLASINTPSMNIIELRAGTLDVLRANSGGSLLSPPYFASATTTQPNDVIIGDLLTANAANPCSFTAGSGWGMWLRWPPTSPYVATEFQNETMAGTYLPDMTASCFGGGIIGTAFTWAFTRTVNSGLGQPAPRNIYPEDFAAAGWFTLLTADTLLGSLDGQTYGPIQLGTNLSLSGNTLNATNSGGTVTVTGSPVNGNMTKFSGSTSITNGDLSGDVTTSGTLATTVGKVNGVSYPSSPSTNGVPVVTGTNTVAYHVVPNCPNDGAHGEVFDNTTQTWTCAVISAGSIGGLTSLNGDNTAAQSITTISPLSISNPGGGSHVISCPGCATTPAGTVGGIIGGFTSSSANNQNAYPFFTGTESLNLMGAANIDMFWGGLAVYTDAAGTPELNSSYQFIRQVNNSITASIDSFSDIGRVATGGDATAGVKHEAANAPALYHVGTGILIGATGLTNATTVPTTYGYAWNVYGTKAQPLGWFADNSAVGSSSTKYAAPSQGPAFQSTEALTFVPIPFAGTLSDLCMRTAGSQPASGNFVLTVRTTHAGVTSSTSMVITVPLSGNQGVNCDHTDTASVVAGDFVNFQFVNNATGTSIGVVNVMMSLTPTGGSATGMVVFNLAGRTVSTGGVWTPPYVNYGTSLPTEAHARSPMPRAVVLKNFYCVYTTPPGTNSLVATVYQNGSSGAVTATIPTTGSGTQVVSDLTHSISFSANDYYDLGLNQTSGTTAVVSACSAEID